jgi:two-component system KDP operon response regulator KdpE
VSENEPLVLLVEDEPPMRRFLRTTLKLNGFRLVEAGSVREGIMSASTHNPEIVLLDLGLPDADGLELIREVRAWSRVPILVLSARGKETDKVDALDAGADDYLTKPFGARELLARIRVALRHAHEREARSARTALKAGPLDIDFAKREVKRDGVALHLTPIEFRLLALLARHAGMVLTHRQIVADVWGPGGEQQTHTLRVHMAQLRRKIEVDSARPKILLTEPGVGYRMAETDGS